MACYLAGISTPSQCSRAGRGPRLGMQRQRQRQRQGGLRTRSPAQLLHSFDASFSARSCSRLLLRWAWQCAGGVLLRRRGMRRRSRALARQQRQVSSSRVPRAPTYDARVTGGLRASLCAHISLEPSHRAPSPRCPKGGGAQSRTHSAPRRLSEDIPPPALPTVRCRQSAARPAR